ncbi:hypothetical protein HOO65_050442 [Ceratocystis lukuohia]|uniref:Extracellular membrane protein CFEM domain-containing protein n=1 Tax=Ceratocystis lukuohia TaxID=2019550 RepID=A0ABR4MGC3_9PEZI
MAVYTRPGLAQESIQTSIKDLSSLHGNQSFYYIFTSTSLLQLNTLAFNSRPLKLHFYFILLCDLLVFTGLNFVSTNNQTNKMQSWTVAFLLALAGTAIALPAADPAVDVANTHGSIVARAPSCCRYPNSCLCVEKDGSESFVDMKFCAGAPDCT